MTERDTPEHAGASPQGCPHEAWEADGDGERCADCHAPGITCPHCNSTLAAPPAPETPPRPESFEDNLRRIARGTGSQAAEWFAERVIAAAQPNAESAAVQKCEGIPDIWDGRDWGAQHCDGCVEAQALRERCEGLEKGLTFDEARRLAEEIVDTYVVRRTMGTEPAFQKAAAELTKLLGERTTTIFVARAALSGGGWPSK